jgi:hypothetical protein
VAEPAITLPAVHHDAANNAPVYRIVIHATAGGRGFPAESAAGVANATARYFQSASSGGSAHYVEDLAAEEHCVADAVVAWHAPPNVHSLGIEICGEAAYTREQWLSPQVWPAVLKAAARARELADRFGVPLVKLNAGDLLAGRSGVCGHFDVSQAWHQSSHWDPGPDFPWAEFLAAVIGEAPPPPPPLPPACPPRPGWTLPAGHYYGNLAGPAASHGGYYAGERPIVKIIQQWLIYHGCVAGVPASSWATSGWADGRWEAPTDVACRAWYARFRPGQPYVTRIYADDYGVLIRP